MRKNLFFLLFVLVLVAIGVYANEYGSQNIYTLPVMSLSHLKSTYPENNNQLTAQNWDELVDKVQNLNESITHLYSEVQLHEDRIQLLEKRSRVTSSDLGWYLSFHSHETKSIPICPSGFDSWQTGKTPDAGVDFRSRLCKKSFPAKDVAVGSTCVTDLKIDQIDGKAVTISYYHGTVDDLGQCLAGNSKSQLKMDRFDRKAEKINIYCQLPNIGESKKINDDVNAGDGRQYCSFN